MKFHHYVSSAVFLALSIYSYKFYKDGTLNKFYDRMEIFMKNSLYRLQEKEGEGLKLDLATIDMTAALSDSKTASKQVYNALKNVGFAYLVNIPGFKPDELLEATKWFFSLPLESKMNIAKQVFQKSNQNVYRGYYPVIPGGHSYKEAFEVGVFFGDENSKEAQSPETEGTAGVEGQKSREKGERPRLMRNVVQETNKWPKSQNPTQDKKFQELMEYTYKFYADVAEKIMHLMAEGLGLESNYFDPMFGAQHLSTLRLLHYPTRINHTDVPDEAKDGDTLITTGEHCDTAILTVLATFENKGLQVKLSEDGPWLDVPPKKDALVINIGALISKIVNNKLIATNHRVIDLGTDRYSVPFFYEPNFDADVSKAIDGELINPVYKKYGPWMVNRTSQFAEYATTDFGIAD